jgi:glycyl-tRNA synthetase (class II)
MQMQQTEFNFPFGFKELEGFTRTDFDLKAHEKFSENFNILMPN